ncbi:MAG: heavy-metal-associated domain-containing protein [Muribaculaceae bacterium]|nr:heavy-metal-associated domain-containing protein [Muribaculaceae bacterium]
MKRIILPLLIAGSVSLSAIAADNDTIVNFSVNPPMHCVNCENKIKTNLRFEKGIKRIDTSIKSATVTVKFDKTKTSVDKLIPAFKKIGYRATPINKQNTK